MTEIFSYARDWCCVCRVKGGFASHRKLPWNPRPTLNRISPHPAAADKASAVAETAQAEASDVASTATESAADVATG
jgi:hypothetical protein